jgi:hypothetical protein
MTKRDYKKNLVGAFSPQDLVETEEVGPSFPSKFPAEILTTPGTLQAAMIPERIDLSIASADAVDQPPRRRPGYAAAGCRPPRP